MLFSLALSQVGILFSGKKLTHLQRQVCAHILQGIQRETIRLKEEWEAALGCGVELSQDMSPSRVSDSYCFELLSQVSLWNTAKYELEPSRRRRPVTWSVRPRSVETSRATSAARRRTARVSPSVSRGTTPQRPAPVRSSEESLVRRMSAATKPSPASTDSASETPQQDEPVQPQRGLPIDTSIFVKES